MSKVEPNRNVYVGHRYVPKIFGEWNKQNEYEGLSIVTHEGTSYTSKKRVPVGIDILNEEFWVVTGNYNAQIEYYRDEVRKLGGKVTTVISDVSDLKSDVTGLETSVSDINKDVSEIDLNLNNLTDRVDSIAVNVDTFLKPSDAVQFAYNNDMVLDWGSKDHVITDDLKNFHDVNHIGYGSITIDGNTYYLNPKNGQTNRLYVSSNGSDTNSGLSFSKGLASLQRAFNILRSRSEVLGGQWELHIGPGHFGGARLSGVESLNQLKVIGSVDLNNEPTTKIVGSIAGGTAGLFGIRVEPGIKDLQVNNISFEDFNSGSTTYGFLMKSGGKTIVDNCRAKDCTLGFAGVNSSVLIASSCIAENCDTGFTISYGASGTFGGSGGLFGSGSGSKALSCVTGVSVTRNAVAHVDYMEIEDCSYAGVDVNMSSRVHVLGTHFKRNLIGVDASGSSEWINNTSIKNYFYENTADENGTNYGHFGVARETRLYSQRSTNEFRTYVSTPAYQLTGTTSRSSVVSVPSAYYIPEYFLKYPGRKIRIKVTGRYKGSASGTKKINVVLQNVSPSGGTGVGTDSIDSFDYSNESSSLRPFVFDLELDTMGNDKAVISATRNIHLASYSYAQSFITNLSDTSLKKQMRVTAELSNPEDTIYIDKVEMYIAG